MYYMDKNSHICSLLIGVIKSYPKHAVHFAWIRFTLHL